MAKVSITLDTESHDLEVTIDGMKIENVCCATVDVYDDEVSARISTSEKGDNEVRKYTTYVTSDSKYGKEAVKSGTRQHAKASALVVLDEQSEAERDILSYLKG